MRRSKRMVVDRKTSTHAGTAPPHRDGHTEVAQRRAEHRDGERDGERAVAVRPEIARDPDEQGVLEERGSDDAGSHGREVSRHARGGADRARRHDATPASALRGARSPRSAQRTDGRIDPAANPHARNKKWFRMRSPTDIAPSNAKAKNPRAKSCTTDGCSRLRRLRKIATTVGPRIMSRQHRPTIPNSLPTSSA